jgi:hypothetical protein
MTTGANLPSPPPILIIKHQKKILFDHTVCTYSQNQPCLFPLPKWIVWCGPRLCKKVVHGDVHGQSTNQIIHTRIIGRNGPLAHSQ